MLEGPSTIAVGIVGCEVKSETVNRMSAKIESVFVMSFVVYTSS